MFAHGSPFNFATSRAMLTEELWLAHDCALREEFVPKSALDFPYQHIMRQLSYRQEQFLLGNSLLLPAVGRWMLYVLSNLQPLDEPIMLPKPPPFLSRVLIMLIHVMMAQTLKRLRFNLRVDR